MSGWRDSSGEIVCGKLAAASFPVPTLKVMIRVYHSEVIEI